MQLILILSEMASQVIENNPLTARGYVATQFARIPIVKAFNSSNFKVLEEQVFQSGDDCMVVRVASDEPQAKQTVKQLIEEIGFAPQDIGDLKSSTIFEPNAPLHNKNLKICEAEALLR